MALTEHQQELIQGLKIIGVDREDIVAIMLLMETDEMADRMIDWLVEMKDEDLDFQMLLSKALALNTELGNKHYSPSDYKYKRIWAVIDDKWFICEVGNRKFVTVSATEKRTSFSVWYVPPFMRESVRKSRKVIFIDEYDLSDEEWDSVMVQLKAGVFLEPLQKEDISDAEYDSWCRMAGKRSVGY